MVTSRRNFIQATLAMGLAGCMSDRSKSKPLSAYRRGPLGKIVGELPPGRYDAHMHVYINDKAKPEEFWAEVQRCGFNGGCLFSRWPDARSPEATPEKLMDRVIAWTSASPTLYPFYWIDPAAPDALDLVDMAVEKGIYGFKVIRSDGMPCDEKTLPVYAKIAETGKPLTFHSGILWDGKPSSDYFRPAHFEPLLDVPGLRFALAHVSWPWHDECLAVYGKLQAAVPERGRRPSQMFIDTTPGTPMLYREEVIGKVFKVGYNMKDRVMFGTDASVQHYDKCDWAHPFMPADERILRGIGQDDDVLDSYFRKGLQRFLFG